MEELTFCCNEPRFQLEDPFDEELKDNYIQQVFAGLITTNSLDLAYHNRVTRNLMKPVIDNIGNPADELIDGTRLEMALAMRKNVFEFSAAKQYQQARAMSALIDDQIEFNTFKNAAGEIFDLFNDSYLRTEFDTAVTSTQNASAFVDALETFEDFPLIQYVTQRDSRVRPAHSALDRITLPVNHPFWRRFWPPNGWNCRCFVIKRRAGEANQTRMNSVDIAEIRKNTPELFRQNPGLSGQLFDKSKHPYFDVRRGDSQLRDDNFGLPNGE